MKISPYDKVQALKRSKNYHKDYRKYVKKRLAEGVDDLFAASDECGEEVRILSKAGKELCRKWNIRFPLNPDPQFYSKGEEFCVYAPVTYLTPINEWQRVTRMTGKDGYEECITHVDGKLVLMIDSAFSKDQIKKEMDRLLSIWTRETKRRTKSSRIDIWWVYDQRSAGKTFSSLAKTYARTNTDAICRKVYLVESDIKLMQEAFEKAQEIIKAVDQRNTTTTSIDPMEFKYGDPTKDK